MTSFLFWNTQRKPVHDLLAALVADNEPDVIALAEPPLDRDGVLEALNARGRKFHFQRAHDPYDRIHVFSRHGKKTIVPWLETEKLSVRILRPPGQEPVLLVLAHLWSKAFFSDNSQLALVSRVRETIDKVEQARHIERTILLGDLNIDPYSAAITSSEGIHSVMCRQVAKRGSRIVDNVTRKMFFNPMWSLYGDHPARPPGTYYKDLSGDPINYFWHMFDQILFRPCLIDEFNFNALRIVTRAGATPLLTARGFPDEAAASDHLPFTFAFSFIEKKGSLP